MQTFHCQGCRADFLLPPTAKSAVCAYCASAHVIEGDARELVEPDAIVPMAFKQREAIRLLVEWVEKNKIEPQGKVQPPRGVYLPVWTFDIVGNVPWKGMIYRNKKYVPVSDVHPVLFNDVSIPAVKRLSELVARLLPEFDLPSAAAYDPRYLAGWPAEVYERSMSDASLDARQQAVQRIKKQINIKRSGITDLSYSTTSISIVSFKLIFVPVWITTYPFEDRPYTVLINGASGQVHGETPERGIIDWFENLFGK
jgi:LSD1 subclass zinc finger protein